MEDIMKKGNWLGYLLYFTVVALFVYIAVSIGTDLKKAAQSDFDIGMYAIAAMIFNIVFGIIIGMGSFVGTLKESGRLRPNWPKLTLLGLPALLLVVNKLLFFMGITPLYMDAFLSAGAETSMLYAYAEILLGYVIATGMTRDKSTRGRMYYQ